MCKCPHEKEVMNMGFLWSTLKAPAFQDSVRGFSNKDSGTAVYGPLGNECWAGRSSFRSWLYLFDSDNPSTSDI